MRTLHVLSYSPWSERARWALLHHQVAFRERQHVPLIGELALRFRSGVWKGKASVPLLTTSEGAVRESRPIAEYAETTGKGSSLLPVEKRKAIAVLDDRIEAVVHAGRGFVLSAIMEHDDAAVASLPRSLRWLPFGAASARLGTWFVARKYRSAPGGLSDSLQEGLRFVEATLAGRDYVHSEFTYADILCASALQFVNPVDDRYVPLEPALRKRFTQPDFVRAFPALFDWRDALYAKHRPVGLLVV